MTVGTFFFAVGIYFFRVPNKFIVGGASGLSIILSSVWPKLSTGTFIMGINILSIVFGLTFLGKSFSWKTIYCTMIYSVTILIFEHTCKVNLPLSDEPVIELFISVILCGVGSGIVFNSNGSTGGIEVFAIILKQKTPLTMGNTLMYFNLVIALMAAVLYDAKTCMFSVLGVLINCIVVDNVIEMLNSSRLLLVVAKNSENICKYINNEIDSGATIVKSTGSYANSENNMIFVALSPRNAMALKKYIQKYHNSSYVITLNAVDRGF